MVTLLLEACASGPSAEPSPTGESTARPASATTSAAGTTPSETPASPSQATAGATPSARANSSTTTSARPTSLPDEAKSIDLARQDLAKREGVPADQIGVVSVQPVAWPTTALGCPRPGVLYAQLVTPGYRITLKVGNQTFEYHSDRGRRVVTCGNS